MVNRTKKFTNLKRDFYLIALTSPLFLFINCDNDNPVEPKTKASTTTIAEGAPETPSNFHWDLVSFYNSAGQTTGASVYLKWKDNSDDEDGFVLERNSLVIDSLGPNETNYTDYISLSGKSIGTHYYTWRIKAYNENGESSWATCDYTYISTPSTTSSIYTTTTTIYTTTSSIYTTSSSFSTSSYYTTSTSWW